MNCANPFLSIVRPLMGRMALSLVIALTISAPARSQQAGRTAIIRDAEIERLMRDYARPILKAAGLNSNTEIVLINDPSFNAFVSGRRIFINTGAIMRAQIPGEIIGVLAHETGHLAGGHQFRLRERAETAEKMAVLSAVLGLGVSVAGAAAKNGEIAQAGGGIVAGGAEAAKRSLLSYQRGEEMTADRSAITYLNKTGQSAAGLLATFERFADALSLSGTRVDPYRISHPMPQDRIANLQTLATASPYFDVKAPPALQARHDMARAKIAAYTMGGNVIPRLFRNDPKGIGARYGAALVAFLSGSSKSALAKADALAKEQPNNPYFQELRGDIFIKLNKPAEAAKAFQRAMKLDPEKSSSIQVSYGQALMLSGQSEQAIAQLKAALQRDRDNFLGYRYLAQSYGQAGDVANAELATADMHYYSGNLQQAKIFAARAQRAFKIGSPAWMRADDIIKAKARKKK